MTKLETLADIKQLVAIGVLNKESVNDLIIFLKAELEWIQANKKNIKRWLLMKRIRIDNVDLMSQQEEDTLKEVLLKLNVEFFIEEITNIEYCSNALYAVNNRWGQYDQMLFL